jgi:NAD(P)-dependent dehydrogenase (short-subunit alcohol dehydrogenase family)
MDMNRRFEGQVAMITGAAGGIGAATALAFAKEGAAIVAADMNEEMGKELVSQIESLGEKAIFVTTDVSKSHDCQMLLQRALEAYGKVDILFNNAGITRRACVVNTTEEEWDAVMNVNLKSIFLMCKYVVPIMRSAGKGVIVNTASGWGIVAGAEAVSYCASKGGTVLLTKAMAIDHGPQNIRVNCVCPGDTHTPMLVNEARQLGEPDNALIDGATDRPLQRVGRPEEIASAVLFLASDEASFITGEAMIVDGGGLAGSA